jgi:alpha-glucosidase
MIPFFRNHTEKFSASQEPWSFGEPVLNICRKFINLRYTLISHFYSLFHQASKTGEPIIRPMFYHYQDDENTHHLSDQFMLGDSIIVAPIIMPGMDKRMTYLPRGTWYEWEKNEPLEGGRYIISSGKLDEMPLYVKAGSIIPRNKVMNYLGEQKDLITLDLYPGAETTYEMYIDDGNSLDHEKGKYSLILFHWDGENLQTKVKYENYEIPEIKINII